MTRRASSPNVAVVVLLMCILLAVVGGVGFGVWAYSRAEERRKDEIRIGQLDRLHADMEGNVKKYEQLELQFESEDNRRETRLSRQSALRDINDVITEQNALVRKWPELHRKEKPLRRVE